MDISELKKTYNELISSYDITNEQKQDLWTILMEIELNKLSEEVLELEKEFFRKKEQLSLLEKYYDNF